MNMRIGENITMTANIGTNERKQFYRGNFSTVFFRVCFQKRALFFSVGPYTFQV